jgi:membrane associated rhomboid family serine protease
VIHIYYQRVCKGATLSTLPIATEFPLADGGRVYVGRARTQLRYAALLIVLSLVGLTQFPALSRWYHGGPVPTSGAFWSLSCLLLFPLGLVLISNAIRGLPRLTIGPQGISLQLAFKTKWANWDSVDPFVVKTVEAGRSRRQVKTATSRITGPNASQKRSKPITIANHYDVPIEEIAADINAARASSLGISHMDDSATAVAEPTPVGLPGFSVPWVTFALLAVLIGVFILENSFPVTPAAKQAPSLFTLIAMGALDHAAIVSHGQWYRLFTAPLLHANFAHLAGNSVALLLGGWLLERLVGHLWFSVFFAVGALGGSIASLAIQPPNLISVGASGALMGMFAGVFVSSFRMSSATSSRTSLQFSSLRILVPSLVPSFSSSTGVHIDYGAHFGGALAGAALALILLRLWPKTAFIPQARRTAAIIATVSVVLFVGSAGIAIKNYPLYAAALTPPAKLPATTDTAVDGRAAYLRGNNTMSSGFDRSLGKCAKLFPTGQGAVPGINCAK